MENTISNVILSPENNEAIYQYNGKLMLLDERFQTGHILVEGLVNATHVRWSLNGLQIGFIDQGKLKIITVSNSQIIEAPFEQVTRFEWGTDTIYVTAEKEQYLYKWVRQDEPQRMGKQTIIEAFSAITHKAVVKCNNKLYLMDLNEGAAGELMEMTSVIGQYEQAVFSFNGSHIAYIGTANNERHLYVFDVELGLTQNLTEMLDVYVGDAMNPSNTSVQGVKEVQWIETDALYFLLSSDGDVRMYYADLYGSVFPASPESEYITSYAVANSGNWTLYVAKKPFDEVRLDWFDITIGEGRTIVSHTLMPAVDYETHYEMVEVANQMYYVWGYVPSQCEQAVVVTSGRGRMLGNGYDARLADWLNEQKAVVYVNHPGALGYGMSYASFGYEQNKAENTVDALVTDWLQQKVNRPITLEIL